MPKPKTISRQIGEAISELIGYPPVKYLPNYDRGSAIFWELRKFDPDKHEEMKKRVEERLVSFNRKIEVKVSTEKGTTRIFVFIHHQPANPQHIRPRGAYGRTFGRKRYDG